ncbi:E3 ubiquitin-protein ligase HUWE1 [Hypsibius exemplaris]|uniref:E3 ubiquitin-protein ligase HUWE1 n=1 Tax=Hypsibius exemplaris TaxID=2072580 RepID=A0A1W0WDW3_HYPEX|nr:E3 ubiquitin-protein ligase HUWE1 [Hypsibius exemplaris]
MASFQNHNGLSIFTRRLEHEVEISGKRNRMLFAYKRWTRARREPLTKQIPPAVGNTTCRAAQVYFEFLKKIIPDATFTDSIRHLMDGTLPSSLKHIISNADYYGHSLFLLATDIVTVYVFHEPAMLTSLQLADSPTSFCKLSSLKIAAVARLPRGHEKRRNGEGHGDMAAGLGAAVDELMRHQPSLRTQAMQDIVKLLNQLCEIGRDSSNVCPMSGPVQQGISRRRHLVPLVPSGLLLAGPSSTSASDIKEKLTVPLMDYIINVTKFVEAVLTSNSTDDHCRNSSVRTASNR